MPSESGGHMSSRAFVTRQRGGGMWPLLQRAALRGLKYGTLCVAWMWPCINTALQACVGQVARTRGSREKGRNKGNLAVPCPSTWDWRAGGWLDGNLPSQVSLTMRAINTKRVNGGWETWGHKVDMVSNRFLAAEKEAELIAPVAEGADAFLQRRKLKY